MNELTYLIPNSNISNLPIRRRQLNTLQVALLKAHIRQRGQIRPPLHRSQHIIRNIIILKFHTIVFIIDGVQVVDFIVVALGEGEVGVLVGGASRGEFYGLFGRGGGGGVEVVSWVGIGLDGGGLDCFR